MIRIATLFTFYIASMFTCSIHCHPVHTLYITTLPPCSHLYCHQFTHSIYCHHVRTLYIATMLHTIYCHPVHTLYILPPCSHTLYCTFYIATLFTFYIATLFTRSIHCHHVHTLYITTMFAHLIGCIPTIDRSLSRIALCW